MSARPELDVDAEQEVDFGRYWRAIAARWWLPLAGLVGGLLVGYLVSLGTGSTSYRATAQVYLGVQLGPESGSQITSTTTVLGQATHQVQSEEAIRRAAAKAGLKPSRLRGRVSAKPILGTTLGRVGTPAPLLAITVTGAPPRKVAVAANELAAIVIDEVSTYTDIKIEVLGEQLAIDQREIARVNSRLTLAREQQAEILGNRSLPTSERLLLLANINTALITGEQRLGDLEADRLRTRQFLSLAEDVERARVVSEAIATKSEGPNNRTGAVVGGLIGLILGVLAALLWEPLVARRTRIAS